MKRFAASAGALALLTLGSGAPALAQDALQPLVDAEAAVVPATTEERVVLRAGDVFDMIADPGVNDATYSWILTQERTFIEAGRERMFRYRFVQEQTYTLRAEVVLATGERRQRTFVIEILAQGDASISPVYPAGTGASLAGTIPAPDTNGRVVLTPAQHLIQLSPVRADLSPLALDIDAARDTDGDGNTENDVDNTDTYFHSFGRSLWIWFARPISRTDLIITAVPPGESPLVQRISVFSEEAARGQGVLTSAVEIRIEQIDDASFGFSPEFPRPIPGDSPLLYEWEFGDGSRSLETNPVHTYTANGEHVVKLHVRDLSTGETVGRAEESVSPIVVADEPVDEPDPTPVDEPDPTPVDEPANSDGLPWGRIILIVGIFIGSLAVGIAIVWLLSFLRKSRSLEQTLESMEKVVAPSKDQAPPSLAIKSKPHVAPAQAEQKIIDAEINAASPTPVSTPVSEAAAPSWLKKGLAADQSAPPPSTPAAPSSPKPVPPAAMPAPKPQAPATPAAAPVAKSPVVVVPAPTAPVVPKPTPVPASVPTPTPKPQPAPAPTPAPASKPIPAKIAQASAPITRPTMPPATTPAAEEAPDPAKLPRWLQPATPTPAMTQVIPPAVATPFTPAPPSAAPAAALTPKAEPAVTPKPVTIPQPQKTAPVPAPVQPKPVTPSIPQTPPAAPIVPIPSAAASTPSTISATPTMPPAPMPMAPVAAPTPIVPIPPVMPIPAPASTQVMPPPATSSSPAPFIPKNDDDRPIAIIRADSLDPEQQK